ncbi:hypothetical protein JOD45_002494 [Scopulibacillus daqui]|uniref:Uncharacterized protein n=1 Tax=Scopulibacillus daqui TaxID=1469162 RepID=A0ABS2Q2B9_9BACL|nr:hypothetical protein [Scopulibacillus daqui]
MSCQPSMAGIFLINIGPFWINEKESLVRINNGLHIKNFIIRLWKGWFHEVGIKIAK